MAFIFIVNHIKQTNKKKEMELYSYIYRLDRH